MLSPNARITGRESGSDSIGETQARSISEWPVVLLLERSWLAILRCIVLNTGAETISGMKIPLLFSRNRDESGTGDSDCMDHVVHLVVSRCGVEKPNGEAAGGLSRSSASPHQHC